MADPYDVHGEWLLEAFPDRLQQWRESTHPPKDVYDLADAWWPSRAWTPRSRATRVAKDADEWFAWIPDCYLPDLDEGLLQVQCLFRVLEIGHRVVCDEFRTVRRNSPSEVDRFDGMG